MSKLACNSKHCEKMEKSQFLLKILNSRVKRGRRVPSKNCDFCNFCDFSKNCENLEKSQFLLKLLNSRVKGGRTVPSKNCDFSKHCEKLEKSQFLLKLLNFNMSQRRENRAQQKMRFLRLLQTQLR